MPTHRDRAAAIRALREAAANVNRRRSAAASSPLEVAAQALVEWAMSRPDLLPPVELASLPRNLRIPAGRPVLVDGHVKFLGMPLEGGPLTWPTGPLVEESPVELLIDTTPGTENTPGDVLHHARMMVTIQDAAAGHAPALQWILERTEHPRTAQLVAGECVEDWAQRRLGMPSAHELLRHAFADPELAWELAVVQECCDEQIAWPSLPVGVEPIPIPD